MAKIVVNAEGLVVGRLASWIAKRLLRGDEIVVVNVEKAVITGKPKMILEHYKKKVQEWRTHYNPERVGPKVPRRPDKLFKRVVRGMLPRKKPRGRLALKRLKVYVGVPEELGKVQAIAPEEAKRKNPEVQFITLAELYRALGGEL